MRWEEWGWGWGFWEVGEVEDVALVDGLEVCQKRGFDGEEGACEELGFQFVEFAEYQNDLYANS